MGHPRTVQLLMPTAFATKVLAAAMIRLLRHFTLGLLYCHVLSRHQDCSQVVWMLWCMQGWTTRLQFGE